MERNIVNNIKTLGIDMINEAKSGHPGIVLGAAPIIYTLYAKHLNIALDDLTWFNRDRFVLSAGHGSALLYSTLYMAGILSKSDIEKFRKIDSVTPGHPEVHLTKGVDASTGPLGQGIAQAVGMAIAGKVLRNKYIIPKKSKLGIDTSLIDYKVYTLCGDGDLMEGISYEALSLAGSLKLDNLIILYDSNNISLDGKTENVFDENITKRFEAMNFNVLTVSDGNSISSIDKAITLAKKSTKPTLIEIKTVIGADSVNEGTNKVHGSPLSEKDITRLKSILGIPNQPFYVERKYKEEFINQINSRRKKYEDNKRIDFKTDFSFSELNISKDLSLREINGEVLKHLHNEIDFLIGGSADLGSSTKVEYIDTINKDFNNRVINFGVREHAMGGILNGMALCNFKTYGSTFLAFADYLKPSIRMSALMNLPVTYIFTHDSIKIGPDGPTHQPIEQLNMLRSIPNFNVFRPCSLNEILGSYQYILKTNKPAAIILSRDKVGDIPTSSKYTTLGGYIVRKERNNLNGIIIATGSEVEIAYNIANELYEKGIDIRVVSMPNRELFLKQPTEYIEAILPKMVKNVVIEFGNSYGWRRFVYSEKYLICVNEFGFSGSKDEILNKLKLDYNSIKEKVYKLLK